METDWHALLSRFKFVLTFLMFATLFCVMYNHVNGACLASLCCINTDSKLIWCRVVDVKRNSGLHIFSFLSMLHMYVLHDLFHVPNC